MRISGGVHRSRQLVSPRGSSTRPTSDRVREALFSILDSRGVIEGARVIDFYAGTGALGLEALSRGAASVTFIERDRRAQQLIAGNVARCGVREGYAIIRAEFTRGVRTLRGRRESFDIVLLDPPYDRAPDDCLTEVSDLVAEGGVVVLEHTRARQAPALAGSLVRIREIAAGDSALTLYEVGRQKAEVGSK